MFTFIELFAGIGGFRAAIEPLGGDCVLASEINKYSCQTYTANWGEVPLGDITQIPIDAIPDHDLLTGGFPCQPFSEAGRRQGRDDTRGNLFLEIVRILHGKKPKAFLLENVLGLLTIEKGQTFREIMTALQRCGYHVVVNTLNAKHYGIPQSRDRVFFVGIRNDIPFLFFDWPRPIPLPVKFIDLLEKVVDAKYQMSERYLASLAQREARHKAKGNGFNYKPKDVSKDLATCLTVSGASVEMNLIPCAAALRTRGDGKILEVRNENIANNLTTHQSDSLLYYKGELRRLTPREYARLQGFNDDFRIVCSDAQSYKQFGNAVCVPVVNALAKCILPYLEMKK